ncbi:MAG: hypothetical protein ABIR47_12545 [Candidatus Kapaibacterium sp.]
MMKTFAVLFVMLALSAFSPGISLSAGNGVSGTGASAGTPAAKKKTVVKKGTKKKTVAKKRTASVRAAKTTPVVQASMKSVARRHGTNGASMESKVRRVVVSAPEASMESKVRRGTGGAVTGGKKQ